MIKIEKLFQLAKSGIRFESPKKKLLGQRLFDLVSKNHFDQFVEILRIFQHLVNEFQFEILNNEHVWVSPSVKDLHRLQIIKSFVEDHYRRNITLDEIAEWSNLSREAFCRYFKNKTQLTFTEYLNQYRVNQSKKLLMKDLSIAEVAELCGFESMSYFNRVFKKTVGENPSIYRTKFKFLI